MNFVGSLMVAGFSILASRSHNGTRVAVLNGAITVCFTSPSAPPFFFVPSPQSSLSSCPFLLHRSFINENWSTELCAVLCFIFILFYLFIYLLLFFIYFFNYFLLGILRQFNDCLYVLERGASFRNEAFPHLCTCIYFWHPNIFIGYKRS